ELCVRRPGLGYRAYHALLKEELGNVSLKKVQAALQCLREASAPSLASAAGPPEEKWPPAECGLHLVELPGRGKGYLAMRRFRRGEVLFQDVAFCSALVGEGDMEELATQCEGRPLEEVMDLTYGAETPELHGILQNNVFHCTREVDCCALFLRVARLNHCCRPNAFVDCARSSATVRCLTDIEEQQEILISYVPVSDPRPLRHEKLAGKGFVCDCLRCQELAHYARPPLVRAPTRTPR
ncbi:N-lysine methyltransferase SMYD2-A (Histone methyltransferase SMYD2-A) (SET and MYND domain-containing protein 2A), partial [Durusdinium trenchii]